MTAPLKRRWLRFSLRTMFAVVTVFCLPLGWLGANYATILKRQAAIKQLERDGGSICLGEVQPLLGPAIMSLDESDIRIPVVRQILGDKKIACVQMPENYESESRLRELFPEANFYADGFPHFH